MNTETITQQERIIAIVEKIATEMGSSKQRVSELIPAFDDELLDMLELSFDAARRADDSKWSKTSVKSIMAIKPLMDDEWLDIYENSFRMKQVIDDAQAGVTFAFYWVDGRLRWER